MRNQDAFFMFLNYYFLKSQIDQSQINVNIPMVDFALRREPRSPLEAFMVS